MSDLSKIHRSELENGSTPIEISSDHTLSDLKGSLSFNPQVDSISPTTSSELPPLYTKQATDPELESPQTSATSLAEFFDTIISSLSKFQDQMEIAKTMEGMSSAKKYQAAAEQAHYLNDLVDMQGQALEDATKATDDAISDLKAQYDIMRQQNSEQQGRIDFLKSTASEQMNEFKKLINAYDSFIKEIEKLGAKKLPDGTYEIPADKIEDYNKCALEYQKSVDAFNDYWIPRKQALEDLNSATENYNEQVELNNAFIENFKETYQITAYLPSQTPYPPVDLSGAPEKQEAPPTISKGGSTIINTYPPSPFCRQTATSTVIYQTMPSIEGFDEQVAYQQVYASIYNQTVAPFNSLIDAAVFSLSVKQSQIDPRTTDPLLNEKPLTLKILEEFMDKNQDSPVFLEEKEIQTKTVLQKKEILSESLKMILGTEILKEILSKMNPRLEEKEVNRVAEGLSLLSIKILQNEGLTALFPSLSIVADQLASLRKDHPVFSILFSASLLNRIQEGIHFGLVEKTVASYMKKFPEASSLVPQQIQELASTMNFGMLSVGIKLLENSLGISGLVPQLLLTDPISLKNTPPAPSKEPTRKEFLKEVQQELLTLGLSPNAMKVSEKTVNLPLLERSLIAALLTDLPSLPVEKGIQIAKQTLKDTFSEPSFVSSSHFRNVLAENLQQISYSADPHAIAQNVVISPPPVAIDDQKKLPSDAIIKVLSETLEPLLPVSLREKVIQQVTKSLFTYNPQDDNTTLNSSIEKLTRDIDISQADKDTQYKEKQHEAFKELMKPSEDFYAFSLKLMDPAYLFIYSMYSGIIYSSGNKQKGIIV